MLNQIRSVIFENLSTVHKRLQLVKLSFIRFLKFTRCGKKLSDYSQVYSFILHRELNVLGNLFKFSENNNKPYVYAKEAVHGTFCHVL